MNNLKIKITDSRLSIDEFRYATSGSCAIDLMAVNYIDEWNQKQYFGELLIHPQNNVIVDCGFKMQLPRGYCGMIIPRSGFGSKGLVVGNLIGLIDNDYRGDIKINLWNRNEDGRPFSIKPMARVAQLLIVPYARVDVTVIDDLDQTIRGEGGFGSTGE